MKFYRKSPRVFANRVDQVVSLFGRRGVRVLAKQETITKGLDLANNREVF